METFLANLGESARGGGRIILMNSFIISVFKFMLSLIPNCIVPTKEMCWPGAIQSILNRKNFATDRYFTNIVKT